MLTHVGERPEPDPVMVALHKRRMMFAWIPLAFAVLVLVIRLPMLPDVIPTHYGLDGAADGWGSKWWALIPTLIGPAILGVLRLLLAHPKIYNFPVEVTGTNAQHLYSASLTLIVRIAWGVSIIFAGITLLTAFPSATWLIGVVCLVALGVLLAIAAAFYTMTRS
ncbi:MAG: DUF1648 domain-containing protein [Actinomycetaceae bacterium]|nr:DUF1648 domain-containing protein [Actinomycetaceae bacterium]